MTIPPWSWHCALLESCGDEIIARLRECGGGIVDAARSARRGCSRPIDDALCVAQMLHRGGVQAAAR
jgi:hypothetical protein